MVTTSLVGQTCTENTKLILSLLKKDDVFSIGVYGMGGVGKTTLVKQIHNSLLSDSDIAGQVYWVTASQDCSLETLQCMIGKAVGLDKLSQEDKERKKALLFQRFSEMKKSVIILDDLWEHYLPEQIGIPLESCGCKTVVTTRSLDVCRRMGCQRIIKIEPLLEEDAWKLFVKYSGVIPSNMNNLAKEIVNECGGLPLALITMGCCARAYDTVHDWDNALNELRKPVSREEDMEKKVFRVLKFSFDSLKDQTVQNCFLCCALFPEDHNIYSKYLVDLWIDAGLFDEEWTLQSRQEKVSRGHAILSKLLNSCLLESSTSGSDEYQVNVKMHDLIRDMAIIITQNHPAFMVKSREWLEKVPEVEQWSKDLVKVSLSFQIIVEIPNGMAPLTPKLTVLLLNYALLLMGIPESFFVHMRALRVLDLSGTFIERLPESVSDLENLRALLLADCTRLIYVPSLAKLSKLRVLDLDNVDQLEEAPKGIERLKCLEKVSYCPWDASDSTGFNKLIESSPSLSCYRFWLRDPKLFKTIICSEESEHEYFWVQEKSVWIMGAELGEDKATYMLPATMETLNIDECDMSRRSLGDVFPSLGAATNLRRLSINGCKGLKYILSSSSSSLGPQQCSSIEDLFLKNLPDLRRIVEFGGCSFSHLRSLTIKRCPKIKVVFPLTMQQKLCTSLEKLYVVDCEELEEIFEGSGSSILSSTSSKGETETLIADPKLRELILYNLPKLGSIYKDLHLCTSLEKLGVTDCPKIERIFEAPKPILALPKLRSLYLKSLPKVSSIHRGLLLCTSLVYFSAEDCLKLKRVPLCDHLICDDSPSTLLSLPSESDNPELWELLRSDYPEDARCLSDRVQLEKQNQNQSKLKRKRSDPEDDCVDTDYISQLSQTASVPAADDDDIDKSKWLANQLLLPVLDEDEQIQKRKFWKLLRMY